MELQGRTWILVRAMGSWDMHFSIMKLWKAYRTFKLNLNNKKRTQYMFNSLEISSFRWFLFEADVAIDIFKYEPNFFFWKRRFQISLSG